MDCIQPVLSTIVCNKLSFILWSVSYKQKSSLQYLFKLKIVYKRFKDNTKCRASFYLWLIQILTLHKNEFQDCLLFCEIFIKLNAFMHSYFCLGKNHKDFCSSVHRNIFFPSTMSFAEKTLIILPPPCFKYKTSSFKCNL